jgi:multidrug efflux pump
MNITRLFILRPVATTLLTAAIALAGLVSFSLLPVSPLPQVDFPAVSVQVSLPGASPETMAATVATPLERAIGRIAGVEEVTSSSATGQTRLSLVFDLDRNIDGAVRDVQGAINAARTLLPTGLPTNPLYRKINPADAPILILAMTSQTLKAGEIYDAASTVVAQRLSQVDGVGQVTVGGSSLPAVRVELSPPSLNRYGLAVEDVRTAIASTNANRPKGFVEDDDRHWLIQANDQGVRASDYQPLILAWRNGAPVRLADVGSVTDSVEDLRNLGISNGQRAILLIVSRQPNANIIDTVDRVVSLLPQLRASISQAIDLKVVMDRTPTIRSSLHEVEITLAISTALVILVVFLFLREAHATLIPSIAVPVSLIGTFGAMYLMHFSLNNLSLMALTVATGFVVDDAIVILENISRHIEDGMKPMDAALKGAKEVTFTVISISLSLVAVFVPLLLMGGLVGRMFREFAVVMSVAVLISLVISLTTTPMMCAWLLKKRKSARHGDLPRRFTWVEHAHQAYERSLDWAIHHRRWVMLILFATIALNAYLYVIVPKGFFPQQDTGRLIGQIQADQSISFQAMREKLLRFLEICKADPDAQEVIGFTGGSARNSATVFVVLKPLSQRKASADEVIARLRKKLSQVPGARLYFQSVQDFRFGGRIGNAQYQYTLQANDLEELRTWEPRILGALRKLPQLVDVNSDQQDKGLDVWVTVDRDTAARLGISPKTIDLMLNDLFGQRQISNIYNALNQYHVVMEAAPSYWQSAETLKDTYVSAANGSIVPLSAIAKFSQGNSALAVNHQGQFPATTLSFNLPPGVALGEATRAINDAFVRLGVPPTVHGGFQGTAKVFQASLANQPLLILAALLTVYIVLGILYESLIHPLTILSTLPSAGVGALIALMVTGVEFSLISLIGVILLIGIVKKNAIMMIDFALDAERRHGLSPEAAILKACSLRFRPIMMTTLSAMLGALPLAIGFGDGSEVRRPLGISIVGGLLFSQALTLYTTPVVYIYLDRFRTALARRFRKTVAQPAHP